MRKHLAPCAVHGCPELTRQHKCAKHRAESEAKRGTATERGYGTEWKQIRASYLERHPYCQDPEGCIARATDVHHLDGEGPFGDNSDSNLEGLCHTHHSQRTAAEQPGGWNT